ncbi:hypothetical protein ABW19_dt0210059 [Dactylella cylindrospora]|nr:hypothetical protein ABW19_dt0210059 [Dactylella cylindrospora]
MKSITTTSLHIGLLVAWQYGRVQAQKTTARVEYFGRQLTTLEPLGSLSDFALTQSSCFSSTLLDNWREELYTNYDYGMGCDISTAARTGCCPPNYQPLGYYTSSYDRCPVGYTRRDDVYTSDGLVTSRDLTISIGSTTPRVCCPTLASQGSWQEKGIAPEYTLGDAVRLGFIVCEWGLRISGAGADITESRLYASAIVIQYVSDTNSVTSTAPSTSRPSSAGPLSSNTEAMTNVATDSASVIPSTEDMGMEDEDRKEIPIPVVVGVTVGVGLPLLLVLAYAGYRFSKRSKESGSEGPVTGKVESSHSLEEAQTAKPEKQAEFL